MCTHTDAQIKASPLEPLEPLEAVIRLRIAPQAACLTFTPVRIRIIDRPPCHVPVSQLHFDGLARGRGEDHQRKSGGARSASQYSTRSAKRCNGAHAHTEHTQCALSQCKARVALDDQCVGRPHLAETMLVSTPPTAPARRPRGGWWRATARWRRRNTRRRTCHG